VGTIIKKNDKEYSVSRIITDNIHFRYWFFNEIASRKADVRVNGKPTQYSIERLLKTKSLAEWIDSG
jgi:hypothetical protein